MNTAITAPLVVVVDDEESIVSALRRVLSRQQYRVEGFTDPRKAIEFIRAERPHVVISDMRMPDMSGQDFLEAVKTIRPECYRVVLSGFADIEATLDVVNRGAISGFLQKPWDTDQLVGVVRHGIAHTELVFENERLQVALKEANSHLEEKIEKRTKQIKAALVKLERTHEANLNVLFNLLSSHPNINGEFAKKVSILCRNIAQEIDANGEFVATVGLAGLLCELGFIGLPNNLCHIPFTKMSAGQIKEFKRQSEIAALILSPASHWGDVSMILRDQYTAFKPLAERLPPPSVGAQIVAVVRDYCRMLDGRYFDSPVNHQKAMAELVQHRGSRYSIEIVDLISRHPGLLETHYQPGSHRIEDVKPGMVLVEDIYTVNNILLLPSGHIFSEQSIGRLKYFQKSLPANFKLAIQAA